MLTALISVEGSAGRPVDPRLSKGKCRRMQSPKAIGYDLSFNVWEKWLQSIVEQIEILPNECFQLSFWLGAFQCSFDSLEICFSIILLYFLCCFQRAGLSGFLVRTPRSSTPIIAVLAHALCRFLKTFQMHFIYTRPTIKVGSPTKKESSHTMLHQFKLNTKGKRWKKGPTKVRRKRSKMPAPPANSMNLKASWPREPFKAGIPYDPRTGRLLYHPNTPQAGCQCCKEDRSRHQTISILDSRPPC